MSENQVENLRRQIALREKFYTELILLKHILYNNFSYVFMEISTVLIKMFCFCRCETKPHY